MSADEGEIVGETYLEGMWDCPNCETANKGSQMACGSCGAQREEDVKFYLPSDAKEITDEAELAAAKAGPDWICGFCDTSNSGSAGSCDQCGGPKGEGTSRKESIVGGGPPPKTDAQVADAGAARQARAGGFGKKPVGKKGGMVGFAILGVLGLLIVSCLFFAFRTHSAAMSVVSAKWVRTVYLQEKTWIRKTATTPPARPRSVRNLRVGFEWRTKKVPYPSFTTKKVKKNLGNGRFKFETRKVKVTKYKTERYKVKVWSFEVMRWSDRAFARQPRNSGPPEAPMTWPQVPQGRNLRERGRDTRFVVEFRDDKDGSVHKLGAKGSNKLAPRSLDELKDYRNGDLYEVKWSTAAGIKELKRL